MPKLNSRQLLAYNFLIENQEFFAAYFLNRDQAARGVVFSEESGVDSKDIELLSKVMDLSDYQAFEKALTAKSSAQRDAQIQGYFINNNQLVELILWHQENQLKFLNEWGKQHPEQIKIRDARRAQEKVEQKAEFLAVARSQRMAKVEETTEKRSVRNARLWSFAGSAALAVVAIVAVLLTGVALLPAILIPMAAFALVGGGRALYEQLSNRSGTTQVVTGLVIGLLAIGVGALIIATGGLAAVPLAIMGAVSTASVLTWLTAGITALTTRFFDWPKTVAQLALDSPQEAPMPAQEADVGVVLGAEQVSESKVNAQYSEQKSSQVSPLPKFKMSDFGLEDSGENKHAANALSILHRKLDSLHMRVFSLLHSPEKDRVGKLVEANRLIRELNRIERDPTVSQLMEIDDTGVLRGAFKTIRENVGGIIIERPTRHIIGLESSPDQSVTEVAQEIGFPADLLSRRSSPEFFALAYLAPALDLHQAGLTEAARASFVMIMTKTSSQRGEQRYQASDKALDPEFARDYLMMPALGGKKPAEMVDVVGRELYGNDDWQKLMNRENLSITEIGAPETSVSRPSVSVVSAAAISDSRESKTPSAVSVARQDDNADREARAVATAARTTGLVHVQEAVLYAMGSRPADVVSAASAETLPGVVPSASAGR